MNALLCIAVLTLLVMSTTSAIMKLNYKCIMDSDPAIDGTIEITLIGNDHGADFYYSGTNNEQSGKCTEYPINVMATIDVHTHTCGITMLSSKVYQVDLKTTTKGVFTLNDVNFRIECDFTKDQTEQVISADPITVADKDSVAGTDVLEDINLELINADSESVTSCDLGEKVSLRATLTIDITSDTNAIKVKSCTAIETVEGNENSVDIIDEDGCNTDVISDDLSTGFEKLVSPSSAIVVSQTNEYLCFKLPQTKFVLVKCTAVFLPSETDVGCDTSGRRKREVSSARGGDLRLLIRVLPENSTLSTRTAPHSDDVCDHRSYLIGLVILGCVLALTVIVTVGMFVVIKRGRHGHESDQTAYANKGMS